MNRLIDNLPDWSQTIDPKHHPEYGSLKIVALDFGSLPEEERREEVKAYSEKFCSPHFDLKKASGLYLFLRVLFELPSRQPRDATQVFGGWQHPDVGEQGPHFNLSWPVVIDPETHTLRIERFPGYFGKGYDAIGEYDFFKKNFPLRDKKSMEQLTIE